MKQNEGPAGPASRVPNLLGLLREDLRRSGSRDWTRPGFIAVAVYRIEVRADARPAPLRIPLAIGYAFAWRFVRGFLNIELQRTATIGRRFWIAHQGTIVIHPYATIRDDCLIR